MVFIKSEESGYIYFETFVFLQFQFAKRNDNPSRITDEQVQHREKCFGTSRKKRAGWWGGWAKSMIPALFGGAGWGGAGKKKSQVTRKKMRSEIFAQTPGFLRG